MAKIIGRVVTTPPPKKLSKYENDQKYVTETELDNKGFAKKTDIPTDYAPSNHNHDEKYQPKGNYSLSNHTHSEYAKQNDVDELSREIVDLETEVGNKQPKGNYLTSHQDISGKLDKNQGASNVGKILVVGTDGNLVLIDMPSGTSGDVTGVVDESNNLLLSGNLADGTYTLRYLNNDGTYSEACTLVVGAIFSNGLFEPDNAKLNYRLNSSGEEKALNGVFYTQNYIELTSANTYLYIKGCTFADSAVIPHSYCGIWYYDVDKTLLGKVDGFRATTINSEVVDEINKVYRIKIGVDGSNNALSYASNIAYARLVVPMIAQSTSTAITSDDVANVVIKLDEVIA